jgi:hypothetical protein
MIAQLDRTFVRIAPGRAVSRVLGYSFFEGRPATTRGRWWNPVVFRNLRFAAAGTGEQVDRPVFIVGMGRSGTTLLGRILAAHPSVGFLNEPKAIWHVVREDEDIIGSYGMPRTGRLYLDADDASPDAQHRAHAMFSWYLRATRSKRLVDKYPELIFRHAFVREIFPEARFLVAVRSPWSTLKSVAIWSKSHTTDDADWWGVRDQKWDILWGQGVVEKTANADLVALDLAGEKDSYVRAAIEWIVTMREAISVATRDPLAQIIRYEELTRRPRDVIRNALGFCQLPPSLRTEGYASAIVSTKGEGENKSSLSVRLPHELGNALDETWGRLDALGQTHESMID